MATPEPAFDADVLKHITESAKTLGLSANEVLRWVLNVTPIGEDPRFGRHTKNRAVTVIAMLDDLDRRIRALNPGSHYVIRKTYFGYRRADKLAAGPQSERSQIFASIRVRRNRLLVTVPLDPPEFVEHPCVSDLTGVGHHGIGDVLYTIQDSGDVDSFFHLFSDWLKPDLSHLDQS